VLYRALKTSSSFIGAVRAVALELRECETPIAQRRRMESPRSHSPGLEALYERSEPCIGGQREGVVQAKAPATRAVGGYVGMHGRKGLVRARRTYPATADRCGRFRWTTPSRLASDAGRRNVRYRAGKTRTCATSGLSILRRLGYRGFAIAQFKRDARTGAMKLLEVNAGSTIGRSCRPVSGCNFPWLRIASITGRGFRLAPAGRSGFWLDFHR